MSGEIADAAAEHRALQEQKREVDREHRFLGITYRKCDLLIPIGFVLVPAAMLVGMLATPTFIIGRMIDEATTRPGFDRAPVSLHIGSGLSLLALVFAGLLLGALARRYCARRAAQHAGRAYVIGLLYVVPVAWAITVLVKTSQADMPAASTALVRRSMLTMFAAFGFYMPIAALLGPYLLPWLGKYIAPRRAYIPVPLLAIALFAAALWANPIAIGLPATHVFDMAALRASSPALEPVSWWLPLTTPLAALAAMWLAMQTAFQLCSRRRAIASVVFILVGIAAGVPAAVASGPDWLAYSTPPWDMLLAYAFPMAVGAAVFTMAREMGEPRLDADEAEIA